MEFNPQLEDLKIGICSYCLNIGKTDQLSSSISESSSRLLK